LTVLTELLPPDFRVTARPAAACTAALCQQVPIGSAHRDECYIFCCSAFRVFVTAAAADVQGDETAETDRRRKTTTHLVVWSRAVDAQ
jgi:hypothetical protein